VPLRLAAEGLDDILLDRLKLPKTEARMDEWKDLVERIGHPVDEVTIHFVGKYTEYEDSYKSINEALAHGGFASRLKVTLKYIEAEALDESAGARLLEDAVGILVAPGFGDRGARGMMAAAEYARTRKVPYLGICYGFQWAVVEFARHVAGIEGADSTEVNENAADKVIYKLRDLLGVDEMGGTMRLGSYACRLTPDSLAFKLYGAEIVNERHRHRYEFNRQYEKALAGDGLKFVGRSLDGKFVEVIELPGHPWFVAVQFHPEFKSKPLRPHPLFAGFIEAAHRRKLAASGVTANVTAIGDRRAGRN
jgi:CTP synthase